MHKEVKEYLRLKRKLVVLEYVRLLGNNLEAYKACGIPKSTFYDWKIQGKIVQSACNNRGAGTAS